MKKCIHPNVVRLIEVIDDPNARKIYLGKYGGTVGLLVLLFRQTESKTTSNDLDKFFLVNLDQPTTDHRENTLTTL